MAEPTASPARGNTIGSKVAMALRANTPGDQKNAVVIRGVQKESSRSISPTTVAASGILRIRKRHAPVGHDKRIVDPCGGPGCLFIALYCRGAMSLFGR